MTADDHKVCLTWPGGGRKTLEIGPDMTLCNLETRAQELLGMSGSGSRVDMTMMEFPPQTLTMSSSSLSSSSLVRDIVPHMMRVHCTATQEDNDSSTCVQHEDSIGVKQKKRAHAEMNNGGAIADSMTSDETESDEAFARRLQQEEEDLAARHVQRKKEENKVQVDSDEALARRLQQEEDARQELAGADRNQSDNNEEESPAVDPTTVDTVGEYWIYKNGPEPFRSEPVLGKWLVFDSEQNINKVWQSIWPSVVSGSLRAAATKVATKHNASLQQQNARSSYVICVYTSEKRMDEVGRKLIEIVQRDIRYKTDEDTANGRYASNASNISKKTLYWHRGNPSFTKPTKMKPETSRAMAKKAEATEELSLEFEIAVTLVGMTRYLSRQNQTFQEGVTRVIVKRDRANKYDPDNAISVQLLESHSLIGYVKAKDHAQLLAPWLDKNLIRIDSSTMHRRVGDSTMELLVKGFACREASDMLETLRL